MELVHKCRNLYSLNSLLNNKPKLINVKLSNINGVFYSNQCLYMNSNNEIWKYNLLNNECSISNMTNDNLNIINLFSYGKIQYLSYKNIDFFRIGHNIKVYENDNKIKEYIFSNKSATCIFSDPCIDIYKIYNFIKISESKFSILCNDLIGNKNWNHTININTFYYSKYTIFCLQNDIILLYFSSCTNNKNSYNIINNKSDGFNFKCTNLYAANYIPEINRTFLKFSDVFFILDMSTVHMLIENSIDEIRQFIDNGTILSSMYFGYNDNVSPIFIYNSDVVIYIYNNHICYSKTTYPYNCNPLHKLPIDFEPVYIYFVMSLQSLFVFSNFGSLEYNLFSLKK